MSKAFPRVLSFRAQLSLMMGMLLAVLLSFVVIFLPARLEREALTLVSYKMSALLDLTAFTIHPAVYLGDVDAVNEALTGTRRDEDVVYIIVSGPEGTMTQINGSRASAQALSRKREGAGLSPDGSMYEGMTTIADNGRVIARLYVGMSLQRLRREILNVRIAVVAVSGLVFAVGLVAVIAGSTYLTRPLRHVAAAAEKIATGDLRERVRMSGSAEVQRLSSSFNAMVDEVQLRALELQRSHDELRRLSKKLLSVQEEERVKIAREVHDEMGQALTVLKMDIDNLTPVGIEMRVAAHLSQSVDAVIELVRRIATELRPMILDDLGLRAALEQQVRRFQGKSGIAATLEMPEMLDVDRFTASTILRIVQEALSNVVRHAEATAVRVRLVTDDGEVQLEIHDNGRGIDPAKAAAPTSLGLLGIRERAMLLGGRTEIRPAQPRGTLVRVILPAAAGTTERQ